MLKVQRRLIEASGMLLVLGAWGLNWISVDHWNEAFESYRHHVERLISGYHAIQTTANVVLESAITRAATPLKEPSDTVDTPYQRVWASGDVRRGWLQRTMNDVANLRFFVDEIRDADQSYRFGFGDRLKSLDNVLTPLEQRMQSLLGSKQDWVPAPAFDPALLSAADAFQIERSAEQLVEQIFRLHGDVLDSFARRKIWWTWIYAGVFFLGTLLLIFAKVLEWHFDKLKPIEGAGPPLVEAAPTVSVPIASSGRLEKPSRPPLKKRRK